MDAREVGGDGGGALSRNPAPLSARAGTTLASATQVLRRLLELHRLDADALAAHAGVHFPSQVQADDRTPLHRLDDLLRLTLPRVGDGAFGLQAARCWHPSYFGALGHAWLVSATLRDALRRAAEYYELIGERGTLDVEDVPGGVAVSFESHRLHPASPAVVATIVDIVLSILIDMCRFNAGDGLRPQAVTLRRAAPDAAHAYARFFGCDVTFGAPRNAFVLSDRDARLALPTSNRRLSTTLDHLLVEELARLHADDVVARCRVAVAHQLPGGRLGVASVARTLAMPARTLQRRLTELDTSFLRIVDETRRRVALERVAGSRLPLGEIAFLVGFREVSSFTRAFRRWTGASPSAWREDSAPASRRAPRPDAAARRAAAGRGC